MRTVFKVKGMHCRSCGKRIEGALGDLGVAANADVAKGEVCAEWSASTLSKESVAVAITKEGYEVMKK